MKQDNTQGWEIEFTVRRNGGPVIGYDVQGYSNIISINYEELAKDYNATVKLMRATNIKHIEMKEGNTNEWDIQFTARCKEGPEIPYDVQKHSNIISINYDELDEDYSLHHKLIRVIKLKLQNGDYSSTINLDDYSD